MKKLSITAYSQRLLALITAAIIVLVPFHAFLTVWAASAVGHYTALRLWKEFLLAIGFGLAVLLLMKRRDVRQRMAASWLWRVVGLYIVVQCVWAIWTTLVGAVSLRALGQGFIIDSRFIVFFFVAYVATSGSAWLWRNRFRLVLAPAAVVVLFGLLQQFLLPYDVLKHFGYSADTVRPYQTIDKKTSYIRVLSTLRGANPLGAYLVVVLAVLMARGRQAAKSAPWLAAIFAATIVLYGSRSRSAWLAALVAIAVVLAVHLTHKMFARLCVIGVIGLVVLGGLVFVFRGNDFVQNTLFHTDETSQSASSSNSGHWSASYGALKQIIREPLGRGPGSAGPASFYNTDASPRIAENYYLQIGQEYGWLGLGLFVALTIYVGRALYERRSEPLALALFASLVGLTIVNLLLHAWADDTLAYIFWGMTGLALARSGKPKHEATP